MTAHLTTTTRSAFAPIAAAARGFLDVLASTSQAARCAREAERLFAMSDAELAKRGLTRDGVIQHAFAPFLAR